MASGLIEYITYVTRDIITIVNTLHVQGRSQQESCGRVMNDISGLFNTKWLKSSQVKT